MNRVVVENRNRRLRDEDGAMVDGNRVYVGRGTRWGNPYYIGMFGDRHDVVELYREFISKHPEYVDALAEREPDILVCSCAPEECHADVLAELLNDRIASSER